MAKNHDLGDKGEQMAANYLSKKGYTLLERGWRYRRYEIDIICKDEEQDIIIFVEVKTRSSDYFGYPEEFVTKAQQKRLGKAAEEYMYQNDLNGEVRFDIVAISISPQKNYLKHIEDAFFFYDS